MPGAFRAFGATDFYNFNPTNYLIRPDERYLLGANAHYELGSDIEAYSEVSYMEDNTTGQIAASGFFSGSGPVGGNYLINCNNPLLQTGLVESGGRVTPLPRRGDQCEGRAYQESHAHPHSDAAIMPVQPYGGVF